MSVHYRFKYGEPISLALDVDGDDIDLIVSVTAKIKKAGPNHSVPPLTDPVLATLTTTTVTGGYLLTTSTVLDPGIYVLDASFVLTSGGPFKSDTLVIEVTGSVT